MTASYNRLPLRPVNTNPSLYSMQKTNAIKGSWQNLNITNITQQNRLSLDKISDDWKKSNFENSILQKNKSTIATSAKIQKNLETNNAIEASSLKQRKFEKWSNSNIDVDALIDGALKELNDDQIKELTEFIDEMQISSNKPSLNVTQQHSIPSHRRELADICSKNSVSELRRNFELKNQEAPQQKVSARVTPVYRDNTISKLLTNLRPSVQKIQIKDSSVKNPKIEIPSQDLLKPIRAKKQNSGFTLPHKTENSSVEIEELFNSPQFPLKPSAIKASRGNVLKNTIATVHTTPQNAQPAGTLVEDSPSNMIPPPPPLPPSMMVPPHPPLLPSKSLASKQTTAKSFLSMNDELKAKISKKIAKKQDDTVNIEHVLAQRTSTESANSTRITSAKELEGCLDKLEKEVALGITKEFALDTLPDIIQKRLQDVSNFLKVLFEKNPRHTVFGRKEDIGLVYSTAGTFLMFEMKYNQNPNPVIFASRQQDLSKQRQQTTKSLLELIAPLLHNNAESLVLPKNVLQSWYEAHDTAAHTVNTIWKDCLAGLEYDLEKNMLNDKNSRFLHQVATFTGAIESDYNVDSSLKKLK